MRQAARCTRKNLTELMHRNTVLNCGPNKKEIGESISRIFPEGDLGQDECLYAAADKSQHSQKTVGKENLHLGSPLKRRFQSDDPGWRLILRFLHL